MLQVRNFQYSIGKKVSPKININIPPYTINLIVGDNGEGKTLFFRSLIDENPIIGGNFFIEKNSSRLKDFNFNYCPVTEYHHFYMTVKEYLEYIQVAFNVCKKKLNELCGLFDLRPHLNTKICNLSDGEKRRFAIINTEILPGHISFYDEPEANLDIVTRKKWLDFLNRRRREKTFLIITHYPKLYANISHQVLELNSESSNIFSHIDFDKHEELFK